MNTSSSILRKYQVQVQHQWDLEADLPWQDGIAAGMDLLPVEEDFGLLKLNPSQQKCLSLALGIIAASAISEHERILCELKDSCWERLVSKKKYPFAMKHLGEQFFSEEKKHSQAFGKYLSLFASAHNVSLEELKACLPAYDSRFLISLYKLDARLGGKALWWTVAATEEESIELFKLMANKEASTDPLFYKLNRLHFEEEVRHSSYAFEMLKSDDKTSWPGRKYQQASFMLAKTLQTIWIFQQLHQFKKIKNLRQRHPFFEEISQLVEEIETISSGHKIKALFTKTSYISMMLNPQKHKRIQQEIKRQKAFNLHLSEEVI